MSKFYIYYNDETEHRFATAYQWEPDSETQRKYCSYLGDGRYAHQDIQFDVEARILVDKRDGTKYALIESRKDTPNLQFETVEIEPVEWVDAF
jgi:hypothetical protein